MRVPPSQSLTRCAAAFERLLTVVLTRNARVSRGQPGSESEHLDVLGRALRQRHAPASRCLRYAPFIEPDTSIRSSILRSRCRRFQAGPSRNTSPVAADAVPQGAAQVGEKAPRAGRASAGGRAAAADVVGAFAREPAQGIAGSRLPKKTPLDQRFGPRRGKAGLIGFVGERWFVFATPPRPVAARSHRHRPSEPVELFAAEEMDISNRRS